MAVSELVTNAYRHAFPGRDGAIIVTLDRSAEGNQATLTVQDDGVGYVAPTHGARRGMSLVKRLIEHMGGTLDSKVTAGTSWELSFPVAALIQ
jgi:two-component sensor histidine kinase